MHLSATAAATAVSEFRASMANWKYSTKRYLNVQKCKQRKRERMKKSNLKNAALRRWTHWTVHWPRRWRRRWPHSANRCGGYESYDNNKTSGQIDSSRSMLHGQQKKSLLNIAPQRRWWWSSNWGDWMRKQQLRRFGGGVHWENEILLLLFLFPEVDVVVNVLVTLLLSLFSPFQQKGPSKGKK